MRVNDIDPHAGGRRMRRQLLKGLVVTGGLAGWPRWGRPQAAPLQLAVVPQMPAMDILRAWTPVLERVSAITGLRLQLVQTPSIPAFEALFQRGEADLIFANPYHMVMARAAQRYEPLLRDGAQALTGVLVVQAASHYSNLQELDGSDVSFPSPNAFGASLYMRALLAQKGVHVQPRYVKTHSNAYRHVVTGTTAAAGGVRLTFEREVPEVRQALRVLFETPPSAPHPLAAHPRLPVETRMAIIAAIMSMGRSDPALLGPIQMPQPVVADYRRDYAPLERLSLQRFVVQGES